MSKTFQIVGNDISDGYHTFGELYEHRIALWITLCRVIAQHEGPYYVWRSHLHSDGTSFEGWFVLGITVSDKQLTYHLPDSQWESTGFARTLEIAPEYDGHTAADVLERLELL